MHFFYVLNTPEHFVVYVHANKKSDLIFALNHFLKIRKTVRPLVLLYSLATEEDLRFEHPDIKIHKSPINFEPALLHHNRLKDRTADKFHNKLDFLKLYNSVAISIEEINLFAVKNNKKPNDNIARGVQKTKEECFKEYLSTNINLDFYLKIFINFIKKSIHTDFNFDAFFNTYRIPTVTAMWFGDLVHYKTVSLENVYYKNKGFYNSDGSFADISGINQDIEYFKYNSKKLSISRDASIDINEPILFLDYIYDFYNFGEFWDIVQRLIYFKQREHVELFGLKENRILNIAEYFAKFNITYPPKYCRDYKHHNADNGNTYLFKKVYFSTINGTVRSSVNPWFAFDINNTFNNSILEKNKKYNLYLSRGKMPRGVLDEDKLINALTNVADFKILTGEETLAQQQYYFTNANLIIGPHSSLMCNTIWCKSNPIFIELTPALRCQQLSFFDDAVSIGIKAVIIPCLADDSERIILTDENISNIAEIVKLLL